MDLSTHTLGYPTREGGFSEVAIAEFHSSQSEKGLPLRFAGGQHSRYGFNSPSTFASTNKSTRKSWSKVPPL